MSPQMLEWCSSTSEANGTCLGGIPHSATKVDVAPWKHLNAVSPVVLEEQDEDRRRVRSMRSMGLEKDYVGYESHRK